MNHYPAHIAEGNLPIFLFHGVISEHRHKVRNYIRKHISRDYFTDVLKSLCARGTPISLDLWVDVNLGRASASELPEKPFVITFDDGFENNYSIAAPILDSMKIPSIFYVTSNFINSDEQSWIDKIECAFEMLPSFSLDLPAFGIEGRIETDLEKIAALKKIRAKLKNSPEMDAYEFTEGLLYKLGLKTLDLDPEQDAKMTWAQVKKLNDHDLFSIGGHGHSHRILDFLSDKDLKEEIDLSLDLLKNKTGIITNHYCYPDGLANCFSQRVIDLLKARNIECSPSAMDGKNKLGDDLFHLKRTMVV